MYKLNADVLLLEELLKKQNKKIKDQGEKLIKSNEEHGKQTAETNAVVRKNDFDNCNSEKESSLLFR